MSRRGVSLRNAGLWGLLLLFLLVQLAFSRHVAPLREAIDEMPYPLTPTALKALAFGDDQFLFRALGLWLQDVGDGGGRLRPLRDYDYDRVVGWLQALDGLDDRAEYAHVLAARYFGAVTEPSRVAKIAEYFGHLSAADPPRYWPWLLWAAGKVRRLSGETDLAARLAHDIVSLRSTPDVPDWLPLVAIPLFRVAGDEAAARALESDHTLQDIRRKEVEQLKRALGDDHNR